MHAWTRRPRTESLLRSRCNGRHGCSHCSLVSSSCSLTRGSRSRSSESLSRSRRCSQEYIADFAIFTVSLLLRLSYVSLLVGRSSTAQMVGVRMPSRRLRRASTRRSNLEERLEAIITYFDIEKGKVKKKSRRKFSTVLHNHLL